MALPPTAFFGVLRNQSFQFLPEKLKTLQSLRLFICCSGKYVLVFCPIRFILCTNHVFSSACLGSCLAFPAIKFYFDEISSQDLISFDEVLKMLSFYHNVEPVKCLENSVFVSLVLFLRSLRLKSRNLQKYTADLNISNSM